MKIDFRDIPLEGLQLSGEIPYAELEFGTALEPKSDLRYDFDIGANEAGLWVTGQVELDVELECVRCLEKFTETLSANPIGWQFERADGEKVDLNPPIREDILLMLPQYPHCDSSGARICPHQPDEVPVPGAVSRAENGGPIDENGNALRDQLDAVGAKLDFLVDSGAKSMEVSDRHTGDASPARKTGKPKSSGNRAN